MLKLFDIFNMQSMVLASFVTIKLFLAKFVLFIETVNTLHWKNLIIDYRRRVCPLLFFFFFFFWLHIVIKGNHFIGYFLLQYVNFTLQERTWEPVREHNVSYMKSFMISSYASIIYPEKEIQCVNTCQKA